MSLPMLAAWWTVRGRCRRASNVLGGSVVTAWHIWPRSKIVHLAPAMELFLVDFGEAKVPVIAGHSIHAAVRVAWYQGYTLLLVYLP